MNQINRIGPLQEGQGLPSKPKIGKAQGGQSFQETMASFMKDVNAMHTAGIDVRAWVAAGLR